MKDLMMKDLNDNLESPFELKISFNKLFQQYERMQKDEVGYNSFRISEVLDLAKKFPQLREGFSDVSLLKTYETQISTLLRDSFSPILTKNEIKTASVPFHSINFNSSERFKSILNTAGSDFALQIKNMPDNDIYIMACTIILNFCYGRNLNLKRPFLYEIPDEKGITRYYKILYNADFTEVFPKKNAPKITEEDIDELLDNFDNIDIWKEKFPPHSYTFKGFVISNLFDVTDDQSISDIKSTLIAEGKRKDKKFMKNFKDIFSSLLNIKDLEVGFSIYNKEDDIFMPVYGSKGMKSFLLNGTDKINCTSALCSYSYDSLIKNNKFYTVSDVDKYYKLSEGKAPQYKILKDQGIKSAILAPIADDELMGILELVSKTPKVLNSINANRLMDVMPYIVSAVERSKKEEENLIEAVIQQECTSIHPSVKWKFKRAAKNFITDNIILNKDLPFEKVTFKDVYPLFGQMDVKGSSEARNIATQKDLLSQLSLAEKIIVQALEVKGMPVLEHLNYQIKDYTKQLNVEFKVDSEHQISTFLKEEIQPAFNLLLKTNSKLQEDIATYFNMIDEDLGVVYYYRKNYDDTIKLINKNMSSLLDKKQLQAQNMYPHFFERFKTDGVEHNMYIGESITRENNFNIIYLYNLRLWQIQVMLEMENAFYNNKHLYPLQLDVASMILTFNQPLSIRFRMDEKQFDVDGTYNARYEVVKKRVDKAYIKGTDERVTEKGHLSIVYSQKEDEEEYLRYVHFFQSKNMLADDLRVVELQDLQGVTGLKAIKVAILYHNENNEKEFYTYDDLMCEIQS